MSCQCDQDYYILLTTSSGLYRYNIRDVVRCVGYWGSTPLLEFRHKGSHISSITGEKITESQVVAAVREACDERGIRLTQFTVTPIWGDPPGYTLYVSAAEKIAEPVLGGLAELLDRCLGKLNCEYREKRDSGRLAEMKCVALSDSFWQCLKQSRLTASGGSVEQYKHPCLMPDPAFERRFHIAAGISAV